MCDGLSDLDSFPDVVLRFWEEGSRPLLAYIADLVAETEDPGVSAAFQDTFLSLSQSGPRVPRGWL